MTEPEEFETLNGGMIPRKISVADISFSAHVDYTQNSEFIELVKAQHVVITRFSGYLIPQNFNNRPRSWFTGSRTTWHV
jgi:hypothetical protein